MRKSFFFIIALLVLATGAGAAAPALMVENDVMSVALAPDTAAISVTDKRTGFVWEQTARPGFHVEGKEGQAVEAGPNAISATIAGPRESYDISLSLDEGPSSNGFDLSVSIPGKHYTDPPDYPFPFSPSGDGWQYVQNTTGEGVLKPMANLDAINKAFGWSGSQPWWGITDLKQAMMARLDSFRLPDTSTGASDSTVYGLPMKICYSFYTDGGYVALAKAYRRHFLSANPEMPTLEQKTSRRPGIDYLRDAVYIYFWDIDWPVTAKLIPEMKEAGIDRAIATFYSATRPVNSLNRISPELYGEIEKQGWLGGRYRMPTPNLSQVCTINQWNKKLLVGDITEEDVLKAGAGGGGKPQWDLVCAEFIAGRWLEKARPEIEELHTKLYYFDTLTVQLAPCLDPAHPTTVEENLEARRKILRETQDLGMVVGSGEGVTPTWSIPDLDFLEGAMSLRTYMDMQTVQPIQPASGGYALDFQNLHTKETAMSLDETTRIPLMALAFHDYVTETWVWRDTTFQDQSLSWKKDLFNILYGAMPIWHMSREYWDHHKEQFLASYNKTHSVREKIGFAEMTGHGWLTPDKSVQYTDWSNGYRVIVNFGNTTFEGEKDARVAPRAYVLIGADAVATAK